MIKINKKDLLNLKTLIEKGSITQGKFVHKELVQQLKLNGSVIDGKKTPKVRYINLAKEENIFLVLKNNNYFIDSVEEIESYIEEIFEKTPSRDEVQKWHNSTKKKESKSLKGLYISALSEIAIKLDDKVVSIIPNNGVGYFLFYTQKIELFEDIVIIGVENYQVVWFAQKFQKFFENKKMLFVVINPFMLEWIENLENEYVHFGDYDLAGINIYLNKIVPRLKKVKKHTMFIPENIEFLIKEYGNSELYEDQKQYTDLSTSDENINNLIKIIRENKKSIEQEGIYLC
jgi:DNA-binding transcriptional regulator/RsmH inhibitor MraZ